MTQLSYLNCQALNTLCRILALLFIGGIYLLCSGRPGHADWVPYTRATLEQIYDSNIFLEPEGEHRHDSRSDFRTNISPTIGIRNETNLRLFSLDYNMTYSQFYKNSDQSYLGHNAALDYERHFSDRLLWYARDSVALSEEPESDTYDYTSVNYGRRRNLTNTGETGIEYHYGPENLLRLFYSDSRLIYLNSHDNGNQHGLGRGYGSDDSVTYGPGLEASYWFNQKNGVLLNYTWERTDYEVSYSEKRDHLDLGYQHRWSPHTTLRADFILDYVDTYDPLLFDYKVYQATVGFMRIFSPMLEIDIYSGFYYRPSGDQPDYISSSDNTGYSGGMDVIYTQQHWNLRLSGEAGIRMEYGDYNNRGYTPYRSMSLDFTHDLTDRLHYYANISYDYEKSPDTGLAIIAGENRRETYNTTVGIEYLFLSWLTGTAEYQYNDESATQVSDEHLAGYNDHRFMLRLSATYDWL